MRILNRDAYKDGFLIEGKLAPHTADAIFLDLPSPWQAIPHCVAVIKKGGKLCNFSPCIEQVQRTITTLAKAQFGDFETFEILERTFERRKLIEAPLMRQENPDQAKHDPSKFVFSQPNEEGRWHTGYLTFCTKY